MAGMLGFAFQPVDSSANEVEKTTECFTRLSGERARLPKDLDKSQRADFFKKYITCTTLLRKKLVKPRYDPSYSVGCYADYKAEKNRFPENLDRLNKLGDDYKSWYDLCVLLGVKEYEVPSFRSFNECGKKFLERKKGLPAKQTASDESKTMYWTEQCKLIQRQKAQEDEQKDQEAKQRAQAARDAETARRAEQQAEQDRRNAVSGLQNKIFSSASDNGYACLDMKSTGDVVHSKCHGKPNQRWSFTSSGEIQNQKDKKCLGVQKDGKLKVEKCADLPSQKWVYDKKLLTINPKKAVVHSSQKKSHTTQQCLEVSIKGKDRSAYVSNCNGLAQQSWFMDDKPNKPN